MKLSEYKFEAKQWPPPNSRKSKDTYLFGFDSEYQPYIVRWEFQTRYEGWTATTLSNNQNHSATAIPRNYYGQDVDRLIKYWADAPLPARIVRKAKQQEQDKEREDSERYETPQYRQPCAACRR